MKKKSLGLLIGALATGAILVSCGGGGGREGTDELWVCIYDGGYGTAWADTLAARYEEKTGTKVVIDADTSILNRIESALRDGGDYDIYMSHGINWQTYASMGYLAELDDLYASPVEGYDGTFADRLANNAANVSKVEGQDGVEHYYKVCWTQGAGGIVYNMDMFEANGWSVPTTYAELVTLCDTINAAHLEAYDETTVRPFAWSGAERQYYWDYPIYEWWAQLAGMDKVETVFKYMGPTGLYRDGYEMYNPDTYYKEFMQAYDMWYDLIAANVDNSTTNSYSNGLNTAKSDFVTGKSAMIPYAQWAKYELELINDGEPLDFDIAMMPTPKATADAIDVNFMVGFGDSMVVPANSPNIELAKDFINFLAEEESCATFVEESHGAFMAFDYSDVDLSAIEATDTYIKSVHDKLGYTNFSSVSTNPITYFNVDAVMPWPNNDYYYQNACATPADYTAEKVGAMVYETARSHWATWLTNAGLSD